MLYFFHRLKYRVIWSWAGLIATWRGEYSFRSWVWANLVSGGLAIWLPISTAECALILALGVLVLAAELMNTAIEHTVDYISTDHHELAGLAKDAASAGVAITAIAVGVAWIVVLVGLL